MPPVLLFGRKWQVATDDFVFPGLVDLLVRIAWVIGACVIYWKHDENLICDGGQYMRIYLYGNFLVLLSLVFLDVGLIQNSMNSYIMDQIGRKWVIPFLYLRIIFQVAELIWNILGTIWLAQNTSSCSDTLDAVIYMKGLIWFNWFESIGLIIVIALVFDPLGSSKTKFGGYDYEKFNLQHTHKTRVWEARCRLILCSCLVNDQTSREAFKEMGKIMSILFEDLDLVPSDLAAGLIALNLKTQYEAERRNTLALDLAGTDAYDCVIGSHNYRLSLNSGSIQLDTWLTPQRINHFMKFALGSYGWPWFVVANGKRGIYRLWENLSCRCWKQHSCDIQGDNCCFCHYSALKTTVQLEESDLIYISFRNSVFQTPFFVAIDHITSSIVISVRGTMSLSDAVTDLIVEAKPVEGFPESFKAHNGMILSAKNVLTKLQDLKLLQKAKAKFPTYDLVIAGHSLGAGTATVLGMMLQKEYPNLRCYAYSPPGGLLTLDAAVYCEQFTVSVVLGDDIVSRLSIPAFEKFKNKLLTTIRCCRVPKYQILMGGCWYFLVGRIPKSIVWNEEDITRAGSDTQLLNSTNSEGNNYCTYVSLAEESHRLHREEVTKRPMFMPGKIMHVTERPIFRSRTDLSVDGPRYEYKWADRTYFDEIIVTPNMWTDHYPDTVWRALNDIAESVPVFGSN